MLMRHDPTALRLQFLLQALNRENLLQLYLPAPFLLTPLLARIHRRVAGQSFHLLSIITHR
jgi:hypothetical protein